MAEIITKKNMKIVINAPILTDPEFIKDAAMSALDKVADAIVSDVQHAKANVFADAEGKWSFPAGGYPDASSYYGSGMIPYWRGELLGSFSKAGPIDQLTYGLEFTAPYAELIEKGGQSITPPPVAWSMDKKVLTSKNRIEVTAHPFVGAVVYKLQENLENFGYLDIFAVFFVDAVR